jgi:hypothetical protein
MATAARGQWGGGCVTLRVSFTGSERGEWLATGCGPAFSLMPRSGLIT